MSSLSAPGVGERDVRAQAVGALHSGELPVGRVQISVHALQEGVPLTLLTSTQTRDNKSSFRSNYFNLQNNPCRKDMHRCLFEFNN